MHTFAHIDVLSSRNQPQCNVGPISYEMHQRTATTSEPNHNPGFIELLVNLLPSKRPRIVTEDTTCTCTPSEACGQTCINRATYTECNPAACPAGSACTNQRLQHHHTTGGIACSLSYTAGKGMGVVADQVVQQGTLVAEYVGEVLSRREGDLRAAEYAALGLEHTYIMGLGPDMVIDATTHGNMARFINHSCAPNCISQVWHVQDVLRVGIFALRRIARGEELTYRYNLELAPGHKPKRCLCGAPTCRGVLGAARPPPKCVLPFAFPLYSDHSSCTHMSSQHDGTTSSSDGHDSGDDEEEDSDDVHMRERDVGIIPHGGTASTSHDSHQQTTCPPAPPKQQQRPHHHPRHRRRRPPPQRLKDIHAARAATNPKRRAALQQCWLKRLYWPRSGGKSLVRPLPVDTTADAFDSGPEADRARVKQYSTQPVLGNCGLLPRHLLLSSIASGTSTSTSVEHGHGIHQNTSLRASMFKGNIRRKRLAAVRVRLEKQQAMLLCAGVQGKHATRTGGFVQQVTQLPLYDSDVVGSHPARGVAACGVALQRTCKVRRRQGAGRVVKTKGVKDHTNMAPQKLSLFCSRSALPPPAAQVYPPRMVDVLIALQEFACVRARVWGAPFLPVAPLQY